MEFILAAMNPATGTDISQHLWLFILAGVVLAGVIVFSVITAQMKKKKNGKRKPPVRRRK